MSTDEKDKIVGALVREYKEASQELALLQEKARRTSLFFGQFTQYLLQVCDPDCKVTQQPNRTDLDVDAAFELAAEITKAKQRVEDLAQRKASLHLY